MDILAPITVTISPVCLNEAFIFTRPDTGIVDTSITKYESARSTAAGGIPLG
jgi:hypothetical protein